MMVNKVPPPICQWAIHVDFSYEIQDFSADLKVLFPNLFMHLLITPLLLMVPSFLQKLTYHLDSSTLHSMTPASRLLPIVNRLPSSTDSISIMSLEDGLSYRIQSFQLTILIPLPKMWQYTHKCPPVSRLALGRIIFLNYSSSSLPSLTNLPSLYMAVQIDFQFLTLNSGSHESLTQLSQHPRLRELEWDTYHRPQTPSLEPPYHPQTRSVRKAGCLRSLSGKQALQV